MDSRAANRAGVCTILLFIGTLTLFPLLRAKSHEFPLTYRTQFVMADILDRELVVVQPRGRGKTTLGALARTTHLGLLVNFWATWCPPCIEEIPSLEQLRRAANIPPLVTVSVDVSQNDVFGLFDTLNEWPGFMVLLDPEGTVARAFGTAKFPETYWIDSSGRVRYRWVGPQDWLSADILSKIKELMRG